jgi:hypothetical protein
MRVGRLACPWDPGYLDSGEQYLIIAFLFARIIIAGDRVTGGF